MDSTNQNTITDPYTKPEQALEKIGGKWKMPLLWRLSLRNAWRYGELKRAFNPISHKMLSRQLRELEADGLIHRELYPVIPPKVEYSLTEKGRKALPAVKALCTFYAEISNDKE